MFWEVRHDKSGEDISGGSYMGVRIGAACGSHGLETVKGDLLGL